MQVKIAPSARSDLRIIKNTKGPKVAQALLNAIYRELDHESQVPGSVKDFGEARYIQRAPNVPGDLPWWIEYHYDWSGFHDFYYVQRVFSAQVLLDQISAPPFI